MSLSKEEINVLEIPLELPNHEIGPIDQFQQLTEDLNLAGRFFTGWAAPLNWGPWVQVANHGGVVNYDISYDVLGDTAVSGAVNWYSSSGWRTIVFNGSVRITTGNAWAAVSVCFFGNPLGSTIRGVINP